MPKDADSFKCQHCDFYPITEKTILIIKIGKGVLVLACPSCKKHIATAS